MNGLLKPLKNNKGSMLITLVGFISILVVIGLAVSLSTATHLRTQKSKEVTKEAFYASESGIDQVIAMLTKKVNTIRDDAAKKAGEWLRDEIEDQSISYGEYVYQKRQNEENGGTYALELPDLYNDNGTINQAKAYSQVKDKYEGLFKDEFIEVLKNLANELTGEFARVDNTDSGFNALGYSGNEPIIGIVITKPQLNSLTFTGNKLVLHVFSYYHPEASFAAEEVSRKLVTVSLTISIPDYTALQLDQNVLKYDPNILWTKAVSAEGNVTFAGNNNIEIDGNVYAGGKVQSGASNTKVVGEVVASDGLRFDSDSSLTIDGNLYAQDIVIDGKSKDEDGREIEEDKNVILEVVEGRSMFPLYPASNGAEGIESGLTTAGNVILQNSLEMRGTNMNIYIKNDFTGFSAPLSTDSSGDGTSCIIVDSPNIVGSHLKIDNIVAIRGIASLTSSASSDDRFDTGESIAFGGNYMTYKNLLTNILGDLEQNYFTQFMVLFSGNHDFSLSSIDEELLQYWNPFGIGIFAPKEYDGIAFSHYDKADYFYIISEMAQIVSDADADLYGLDKSVVNYDDTEVIDIKPGNYLSYGVAVFNGGIHRRNGNVDSKLQVIGEVAAEMYECQTKARGDMPLDGPLDESTLDELFNFYRWTNSIELPTSTTAIKEQIIVTNSNVDIAGIANTNVIKAVIMARGNITLDGRDNPLVIRGMVVAGGNITILGDVTIINDRDYIAKAMSHYDEDGRQCLAGFVTKATIWPSNSFKTAMPANAMLSSIDDLVDNTLITKEDFIYVRPEDDTGITDKYDTIKGVVSASDWKVREYDGLRE